MKRLLFAVAAIAILTLLKRQTPDNRRISAPTAADRETRGPVDIAAGDQPRTGTAVQSQGLEANRPAGPADVAELLLNR